MQLKDIGISFHGTAPSPDEGRRNYGFGSRAQAIASFLTMRARCAKTDVSAAFDGVFVFPRDAAPDPNEQVIRGKSLCIPVDIDWDAYHGLLDDETGFGRFICSAFREGFRQIDASMGIERDTMVSWVDAFEAAGYRHDWTSASKTWRAQKLTAELNCRVDLHTFRLNLNITRDGTVIFDKIILETEPNPLLYYYHFKSLDLRGNTLVVTRRTPADAPPFFSVDL